MLSVGPASAGKRPFSATSHLQCGNRRLPGQSQSHRMHVVSRTGFSREEATCRDITFAVWQPTPSRLKPVLQVYALPSQLKPVLQVYALPSQLKPVLQVYALPSQLKPVPQVYALPSRLKPVLQVYALPSQLKPVLQVYALPSQLKPVPQVYALPSRLKPVPQVYTRCLSIKSQSHSNAASVHKKVYGSNKPHL
jgi:hypothetical protein